jgi:drug/metabolite transporter (DMT)-like permease
MARPRVFAYVVLAAMPLFFVSNMIIGRVAIASVDPWTLAFLRWLLACLILTPIAWSGLRDHWAALRADWPLILLLGFIAQWICGGLVYVGLELTSATNATLIYTASPVLVVLLDALRERRPLPVLEGLGVVLGILGIFAIVLKGDFGALAALQFNTGDLAIAAASASFAVYALLQRRNSLRTAPTMVVFFVIALAGTATLLPFSLWEIAAGASFPTRADQWLSILGLAVFPSVLAFTCYQYGIKLVGPSVTSVFMYLLPPYGVGLAALVLGEELHAYHAVGLVLVISGVLLATQARNLSGLFQRRPARDTSC